MSGPGIVPGQACVWPGKGLVKRPRLRRVALARRTARSNARTTLGEVLRRLAGEIEDDRRTLEGIVVELGFRESKTKEAVAWRARRQSAEIEDYRLRAAREAFAPGASAAGN